MRLTYHHGDSTTPFQVNYALFTNIMNENVPLYYEDACKHPSWKEAMNLEVGALHKNHTWDLCTLPEGKKAIGSKWIYRLKCNAQGKVQKYKARLVA